MKNNTRIINFLSTIIVFGLLSLSIIPGANASILGGFGFHNDQHDLNHDGIVNEEDMIMLLNLLNINYAEGDNLDYNHDGVVDNKDINILLSTLDKIGYNGNNNDGINRITIDVEGETDLEDAQYLNSGTNFFPSLNFWPLHWNMFNNLFGFW